MTAELLRQAADKLDEMAGAVGSDAWPNAWKGTGDLGNYMTLMSPPVAKALAAWLRDTAELLHEMAIELDGPALAVARAVLGEAP